ncbi:uncharacterized protein LOC133736686 [Rosa rugosa]|uniref:uncharacterized protein LOC133736686 n=1 Tax=Rosa rugosa TaxID=74645 RepID=UPI002B4103AE|nr:uncharacterized protein LOC133736686 [Rosa rugosa]
MSRHNSSSTFPSCFRPSPTTAQHHHSPPPTPPPPISGHANLTTCLYHTDFALFSLTWSRSFLGGRSLHLNLLHHAFDSPPPPSSSPSFHLNIIKPFFFWKRHGSKKLAPNILIFWDFSRARFGSGPEPVSAFYVAVVVEGDMTLLLGDLNKEAYAKTRAKQALDESPQPQALVLKREHVVAKNIYTTKAKLGGRIRDIQIDCGHNDDFSRLTFRVDNKRVLQIKRLKWKFRGNERIEVDGVPMHISWDVYNWLFENDSNDGHAVFMFRFEEDEQDINTQLSVGHWAQQQQQFWNFGMNGIEWRKMGKSFSSSSVSMSSAGSCSSSVMEWATMEESELSAGPTGFSLLVYAWRR